MLLKEETCLFIHQRFVQKKLNKAKTFVDIKKEENFE